jgi:PhnB protein
VKIGPQVYVRGSVEAVEMYCKAFGAEITFQILDDKKNTYAHCELSVDGHLFLAVSEAPENCDASPKSTWQSMAFNVYEMGSKEAVQNAFDILSAGGSVIDPLGPCPWNSFCSNLIDKFGVFWWIAI